MYKNYFYSLLIAIDLTRILPKIYIFWHTVLPQCSLLKIIILKVIIFNELRGSPVHILIELKQFEVHKH